MLFLNGTSLDDIITNGADVFATTPSGTAVQRPMCSIFMKDGIPWIDFLPHLNRKYSLPIPDEAIISRNDKELSVGRYAIFVTSDTAVGQSIINNP
jgi:hypothetical protein